MSKKHDYFNIILDANWDPVVELEAVARLDMRQIDGIIFVESYLRSSDVVATLSGKPHLFVHRLFNSWATNSVVPDAKWVCTDTRVTWSADHSVHTQEFHVDDLLLILQSPMHAPPSGIFIWPRH